MKRSIMTILATLILLTLITSCTTNHDKTLMLDEYEFSDDLVVGYMDSNNAGCTNDVYYEIDELFEDADCIVLGTISDIKYYEVENDYNIYKSLQIKVEESFKGDLIKRDVISVLGHEVYISGLKQYELVGEAMLRLNSLSDKYDQKIVSGEDVLIKKDYLGSENHSYLIGDTFLMFLADGSIDTYGDKRVYQVTSIFGKSKPNAPFMLPNGSYASLGMGMGTFILDSDTFKRSRYFTCEGEDPEEQYRSVGQTKFLKDELLEILRDMN